MSSSTDIATGKSSAGPLTMTASTSGRIASSATARPLASSYANIGLGPMPTASALLLKNCKVKGWTAAIGRGGVSRRTSSGAIPHAHR